MRSKIQPILIAVALLSALFTASTASAQNVAYGYSVSTTGDVLDADERDGLLQALEGHYRLHNLYVSAIEVFGYTPEFNRGLSALEREIDALRLHLERYNVPVPENDVTPVNFHSVPQACLIATAGHASQANLFVELADDTRRNALISLYERLEAGSRGLRARALQRCADRDARS